MTDTPIAPACTLPGSKELLGRDSAYRMLSSAGIKLRGIDWRERAIQKRFQKTGSLEEWRKFITDLDAIVVRELRRIGRVRYVDEVEFVQEFRGVFGLLWGMSGSRQLLIDSDAGIDDHKEPLK